MPDMSTVGELLDYLATQPRDRKIVLSRDAEGNGFSPLSDAGESMYAAETSWSGTVHPTPEDLAELMARPGSAWSEEDAAPDDAERVIVLGPVN
jgi:hypothetical protein